MLLSASACFHGRSNEQIVADCIKQLHDLFPSSKKLECTWSSVVKLGQSLYREKPGQDKFRPTQATPINNFFLCGSYTYQVRLAEIASDCVCSLLIASDRFLCGSYTYQDYIDSMEGATKSGLMVADEVIARADDLARMAETAKKAAPEPAAVA